jgi:hypothetical protein
MCDFSADMFGAPYQDAACVEGYMWDLDSFDDGYLTSGGDIPCPKCNTEKWLERLLEDAQNDIPQSRQEHDLPACFWERAVIEALRLNPESARAFLTQLENIEILDLKDRVSSPSRPWDDPDNDQPDIVWRRWPWPVRGMSHHDLISIYPQNTRHSHTPNKICPTKSEGAI